MCLSNVTAKENKKFVAKHGKDTTIRVWKVYDKWYGRLESPFQYSKIQGPGIVDSDRRYKRLNSKSDGDRAGFYDRSWRVFHGIHVFTNREAALNKMVSNRWDRVVVCCHVEMSDFVACNGKGEAVFMKITISPRNYRRAVRGK